MFPSFFSFFSFLTFYFSVKLKSSIFQCQSVYMQALSEISNFILSLFNFYQMWLLKLWKKNKSNFLRNEQFITKFKSRLRTCFFLLSFFQVISFSIFLKRWILPFSFFDFFYLVFLLFSKFVAFSGCYIDTFFLTRLCNTQI